MRTALIIGGGVAGPVIALALKKAGIRSAIFEAYPTSSDGLGGTLAVAPNGLDALRIIGAAEAVRSVGLPVTRTTMADSDGNTFGAFDGLPGLPPSLGMWRSDLCRVLHDLALAQGVEINYGRRLLAVEEQAESVTACFGDGSRASADLLIGADGIHSTVRKFIDPNAPEPTHVPLLNFGGGADYLAPGKAGGMYFVFGKRAFLGYWLQPDGRTAWFANIPHEARSSSAEARAMTPAHWLAKLRGIYGDDIPARDLILHTRPDHLFAFGTMQMMPPLPNWHRGRMVLVGDSVHAPSSSSGQGASLAMESAVELARCLRDTDDLPQALADYVGLRRSRVEAVAARAAKTNNTKALGPAAIAIMKLVMPLAMKTVFTPERMLGAEQRRQIDWDAPVAEIAQPKGPGHLFRPRKPSAIAPVESARRA